jgi:hypothetical protein
MTVSVKVIIAFQYSAQRAALDLRGDVCRASVKGRVGISNSVAPLKMENGRPCILFPVFPPPYFLNLIFGFMPCFCMFGA